jgi:hypothetical protein
VSQHLDEHIDLCASYALDNLDAPERVRLEAHLAAGCAVCEGALREFSRATALLATTAPPVRPPAALRERVLAAARAESLRSTGPGTGAGESPARSGGARIVSIESRRALLWSWLAAAACLALAVWSQRTVARLHGEISEQQVRVAVLEQDRTRLEAQLGDARRWVSTATASDARFATLAPTPDGNPSLFGRAIIDKKTRRAAFAFSNFKAPAGHDYQLWTIRAGKPKSLGVLQAGADGEAWANLDVGDAATLQALAVSLEPAGGSPSNDAPSGPVVMLAQLGSTE